jgi:hypothetical protein
MKCTFIYHYPYLNVISGSAKTFSSAKGSDDQMKLGNKTSSLNLPNWETSSLNLPHFIRLFTFKKILVAAMTAHALSSD